MNILDGQSDGKNAIENTLQEQKQCIDTFIVSKQRRIKLILFFQVEIKSRRICIPPFYLCLIYDIFLFSNYMYQIAIPSSQKRIDLKKN